MSAQELIALLSGRRYNRRIEVRLHAEMMQVMDEAGVAYRHEHELIDGRIDFFIDGIGIEAKVDGGPSAVARQLLRYAQDPTIKELILCTSIPSHGQLPSSMSSKPLHLVKLWQAL